MRVSARSAQPMWRRADNATDPDNKLGKDDKSAGGGATSSGALSGASLLPSIVSLVGGDPAPEPSVSTPTPVKTLVAGVAPATDPPAPTPQLTPLPTITDSADDYPDSLYTTITADDNAVYVALRRAPSEPGMKLMDILLIVGGVVLLLVIGLGLVCCWRKRRTKPETKRMSMKELSHRRSLESSRPVSIDSKPSVDKPPIAPTVVPPPVVDNSAALANGTMFSVMAASLAAAKFNNLRHQPPAPASYQPAPYYAPPPSGAHPHSAPVIRHSAAPAPSTQAPAPGPSVGPSPFRSNGGPAPVVPRAPASVEPSQYDNGKDYKVDKVARDNALANARKGVGVQHMRPLPPSSDAGMTSISRRETGPRRYTPGKRSTPSSAPLTQSTLMSARTAEQLEAGPVSRMSGSRHGVSMSIRRY